MSTVLLLCVLDAVPEADAALPAPQPRSSPHGWRGGGWGLPRGPALRVFVRGAAASGPSPWGRDVPRGRAGGGRSGPRVGAGRCEGSSGTGAARLESSGARPGVERSGEPLGAGSGELSPRGPSQPPAAGRRGREGP